MCVQASHTALRFYFITAASSYSLEDMSDLFLARSRDCGAAEWVQGSSGADRHRQMFLWGIPSEALSFEAVTLPGLPVTVMVVGAVSLLVHVLAVFMVVANDLP